MAYTTLRVQVNGPDADAWSDALLEAGALAVETSDPDAGTPSEQPRYAEPGIADDAPWPRAQLMALVSADIDARRVLALAARALDVAAPPATFEPLEEQDWIRAAQAQFGPIDVGQRLHVVPTWCDASGDGVTIRLDPGLAFGTGSHATTRLCLEWLEENLRGGESVLDYGCGSGILAIAAAKLGAARVVGTDIDAQAVRAGAANAGMNGVAAEFVAPDALGRGTFDVVVANILANPLILLAPALASRVKGGGRIALSGIIETQADEIVDAYARWFTLRAWRAADGWVLIAGERAG